MRPGSFDPDRARPHRRLAQLLGVLAVVGGLALAMSGGVTVARWSIVLLVGGGLLVSRSLAPLGLAGAGRTFDGRGPAAELAATNLRHPSALAWMAVAAVVVAASASVAAGGLVVNGRQSAAANLASLGDVDIFVSTAAGDSLPLDPTLPRSLGDPLRAIPGVAGAHPGQFAFTIHAGRRVLLQGFDDAADQAPAFRNAPESARAALLAGAGTIISSSLAERADLVVGDTITLDTPTGSRSLAILAVVESFTWPDGLIGLPLSAIESWYGRAGASYFEVELAPDADRAATEDAVRALAATLPTPTVVVTGEEYLQQTEASVGQLGATLLAMQAAVSVGAGLIVFATLTASVQRRTRTLGIVRAVGASARTVRRAVLLEATTIGAVGGLLGVVIGIGVHRAAVTALADSSALPVRYEAVPIVWPVTAVLAALVAAVGAVGPARRAGRLDVVEALAWQ
jgi:putative ABC transport system permease protein